jgi:hypothetical protein
MKDRISRELMQLHAVNKKQPMKKFMGRERETAEKKGKKHHPEASLRVRDDLGAREDNLGRGHQKPLLLSLHQISIRESGSGPAHSLHLCGFLCHLLAMGDSLDGHAMARRLKLKESMGARKKKKKWWRRRSKELVNSKNKKGLPLKSLYWKERGLRCGVKSGSGKPTNG